MLAHRHVLPRPGGDPRPSGTPSRAGLGRQARAAVVYALRHEADHPHVTAQLSVLHALAEGLHPAAVDAKVRVTDATVLAVVSDVGVYRLDEIGVAGVEAIRHAHRHQRPGGIQADYPARIDLHRSFVSLKVNLLLSLRKLNVFFFVTL